MKNKLLVLYCLLGIFSSNFCVGQEHPYTMLKKLRKANDTKVISYDYKVQLINASDGTVSDSMSGKVYKNDADYFDSNTSTIIVIQKGFYVNLNKHKKTAMIFDIELVRKKLGIDKEDLSREIISIPDSLILKYGKIKNETLPNGDYRLSISFTELQYTSIELLIDKQTMIVKNILMESNDEDNSTTSSSIKRRYHLYNIRHSVRNGAVDINRFFTVNNKKIIVDKKYSDYQTNTITK